MGRLIYCCISSAGSGAVLYRADTVMREATIANATPGHTYRIEIRDNTGVVLFLSDVLAR